MDLIVVFCTVSCLYLCLRCCVSVLLPNFRWIKIYISYICWERGTARIRPPHAAAAERRPCSNRSISPAHSFSSGFAAVGRMLGQTDGRTPYYYIDPATHALQAVLNTMLIPTWWNSSQYIVSVIRGLDMCCCGSMSPPENRSAARAPPISRPLTDAWWRSTVVPTRGHGVGSVSTTPNHYRNTDPRTNPNSWGSFSTSILWDPDGVAGGRYFKGRFYVHVSNYWL